MSSSDVVIEAVEVRKEYPGRIALTGVDLEVRRGEVFSLLGPNGAGKTSLVEIMEGYRRRTAGVLSVLGEDPGTAGRAWRNRIGIVPQTGATHDGWRVAELVDQIGRCFSNPRPTAEVLELVDLADRPKADLTILSGGQRRRLDLALGIVGRPEILFLDEPSTGLDPGARRDCWRLIDKLRAEGTSIVLTTHYLDEAERLADRIAVLAGGRIVQTARPAQIGSGTDEIEVSWRERDETQTVTTSDVGRLLGELQARLGPDVPELEVRRPSLETRYLQLVGAQTVEEN